MSETTLVRAEQLEAIIAGALIGANTGPANAASVARALTQAEIDGQTGHGLSRVPSYAAQSRSGKVDGHGVPQLTQTRPGALMIDAAHGFAYPAFDLAIDALPAASTTTGIAAAAITRSHHCGAIGRHVEILAHKGLVALAFANTPKAMAPWGGRTALLGTNPLAFGAPNPSGEPLVIDMALAQVARGKIVSAARKGEPIPEGWAVDEGGEPTRDADAALQGLLLPLGGAKGAALAIMVEVLAAALTGANLAFEATSFFEGEGAPPGVGQFLIAIDPAAFAGADIFAARIGELFGVIASDHGARLPGSARLARRRDAASHGVAVDTALIEEVRRLAEKP